MALSPLQQADARAAIVTDVVIPATKTYALDFQAGTLGGFVDGRAALEQFITKAVATARGRFLIYDAEYGSELDDLIGDDVPLDLLVTEIPRVIKEALIADERIYDVANFVIERAVDAVYVTFTVVSVYGAFTQEEVL